MGGGGLRSERNGTRADTATFVACLLLSLIALSLPEGVRAPVSATLRRTVLFPLLSLQESAANAAEARKSVDVLRAQRDSLALLTQSMPALRDENATLRGLLGLGRRLGSRFVTAEVLHQPGANDALTLVLSAGADEGVAQLAPVVTAEGLLGVVRSIDPRTSVALAWTHPDFRASVQVEGRRVFGVVSARRGARSGEMMELKGVAYREALPPGTRVVTSGLGGVFPRGIPVGTVEGVLSEAEGWERTYILRPAVHPAEATHVMILEPSLATDSLNPQFADSLRQDTTPPAARARRRVQ